VLRFLPDAPAGVAWLDADEKNWIEGELAREQAAIGGAGGHNVLAAFRNPRVLLLGALGFMLIGAITAFILNAPAILAGATGLPMSQVGYLVSAGGLIGSGVLLFAGDHADRHGDRFLNAFWYTVVLATAFLTILLVPVPAIVMIAYLAFAASCFTIPMLTSSGWAEILNVRELAVGAAAINTMSQIGAFVAPFAWGAARDATGSFDFGLGGLFVMALITAALVMKVRRTVRGRRAAQSPATQIANA
jgi:ACS family tartrate transporter-like MFS transporter